MSDSHNPFTPGEVPATAWRPGNGSPNPGGRLKTKELRRYIRNKYGEDAAIIINRMHEIAFDLPGVPMKVRVECLKEILDRGWGRPAQSIAISNPVPLFTVPALDGGDAMLPDLGNDVGDGSTIDTTLGGSE